MQNTIYMLFGAALVCLGVLAAALADRIRGIRRLNREADAEWSEWAEDPVVAPRARRPRPVSAADTIFVPDEPARAHEHAVRAAKPARAPRAESKAQPSVDGSDDVIAALVGAGYKRPIATEATWACGAGERVSIEGWTAAALRRCARGAMS